MPMSEEDKERMAQLEEEIYLLQSDKKHHMREIDELRARLRQLEGCAAAGADSTGMLLPADTSPRQRLSSSLARLDLAGPGQGLAAEPYQGPTGGGLETAAAAVLPLHQVEFEAVEAPAARGEQEQELARAGQAGPAAGIANSLPAPGVLFGPALAGGAATPRAAAGTHFTVRAAASRQPTTLPPLPKNPHFEDCVGIDSETGERDWSCAALPSIPSALLFLKVLRIPASCGHMLVSADVPSRLKVLKLLCTLATCGQPSARRGGKLKVAYVRLPGLLPVALQSTMCNHAATFWLHRAPHCAGGSGQLRADLSGYSQVFEKQVAGITCVEDECGSRLLQLLEAVVEAAGGAEQLKQHVKAATAAKNAKYFASHPALKQALSNLGMLTAVAVDGEGPPSAASFAAFSLPSSFAGSASSRLP